MPNFDAYHEWLGISPHDQPPHHYRLLGLDLFELSAGAIENAADRQMRHVRTFQSGRHTAVATKILNQIAAARVCLLNPESKAAYDTQLREIQSVPATATEFATALTASSTNASRPKGTVRKKYSPVGETVKIALGGIAGLAIALGILEYGLGIHMFAERTAEPIVATSSRQPESRSTPVQSQVPKDSQPLAAGLESKRVQPGTTPPQPFGAEGRKDFQEETSIAANEVLPVVVAANAVESKPSEAPEYTRELRPGLLLVQFGRLPRQQGNEGYVDPAELENVDSEPTEILAIDTWKYDEQKNAAVYGYIRIDEPGEYSFRTYNYYDRNALFVNGQLVCPYRGSVAGGSDPLGKERIRLDVGIVPIVSVGYVDAKGNVDVKWKPPEQAEFSGIPPQVLFHHPSESGVRAMRLGEQSALAETIPPTSSNSYASAGK